MPDDFITPLEVAITSSLKDIQETMAHIEESIRSTNAAVISANEASQRSINDDNKTLTSYLIKRQNIINNAEEKYDALINIIRERPDIDKLIVFNPFKWHNIFPNI